MNDTSERERRKIEKRWCRTLNAVTAAAVVLDVADEKSKTKNADEPAQPDSSVSGEFARPAPGDRAPFRPKSTKRRALPGRSHAEEIAPESEGELSNTTPEEQTLRSVRAPQRIRMSLRMRRVAAGSSADGAVPLRPEDRVGLRLAGRVFELPIDQELLAGRSFACGIPLGDRLCSREHAVFSRSKDGNVSVRDLGSTNGTYVNGVRLQAAHRLAASDWITLGNETLELCVSNVAQQPLRPTIPARPQPDSKPRSSRSTAKTDPGSEILSLASLAATSAGKVSTTPPADVARKPLDALLQRVDQGQQISEADARTGTLVALHLARGSGDAAWLDYAFRLHSALPAPLSRELIERLSDVLANVQPRKLPSFRRYVELLELRREDFDAAQRELVTQICALHARLEDGKG
jgi:pSer/pThr/pTyr-binding forkhead associated (FHA) protein